MVYLAHDDGQNFILGGDRPLGQVPSPLAARLRLQPDAPDGKRNQTGKHDGGSGGSVVPGFGHGVQRGVVIRDQVQHGVFSGPGGMDRVRQITAVRPATTSTV